jgi:D-alanyl-D-alanine carboxypeptidase/D-alanyl-D-alanine-endopeptidase (penicillin-binding protein 4)
MKFFLSLLLFLATNSTAQSVFQNLQTAFTKLAGEVAYKNANISFTLLDNKTGLTLFEKNKDTPLAPASTLKTFTTATALALLGENFRYQTRITFKGIIKNKIGYGDLIIYGCGDPSLGSDRFNETKPEIIKKQIVTSLRKLGLESLKGNIKVNSNLFTDEAINSGWLDEDIGNYYGAGVYPLNWKENKFEINLVPTKTSFEVSSNSAGYNDKKDFCIELIHKDGATTEEAFAFVEKNKPCIYAIKGVLSNKEKIHNMQLARLHPDVDFRSDLIHYLKSEMKFEQIDSSFSNKEIAVTTLVSPPLSKLVYWCNQKSLNLYAESFCKTLAVKFFKKGTWKLGIASMIRYVNSKKLKTTNVYLKDGCGLAPDNKITTNLLAQLLLKNTKEKWFKTFYESLPSINGLIMKSGYIGGTRSYSGYIKLKDGTDASFAFIINNYTCTPKEVKLDMFRILDLLK